METFDPQIFAALVTSAGLCFAMVWLGRRMNLLEQRQDTKCPARGVIRRGGFCSCSG